MRKGLFAVAVIGFLFLALIGFITIGVICQWDMIGWFSSPLALVCYALLACGGITAVVAVISKGVDK